MKNSEATLAKRNELRRYWKRTIDPATVPPTITRKCKTCGKVKECRWATTFTQTGKPEYRASCDECRSKKASESNKAKRPLLTTQSLDRKNTRKKQCVDYLGGKCAGCGYSRCAKALTFHHKDPSTKSFNISQRLDRSWDTLVAELDKCELLCFNCHMEEHCTDDEQLRVDAGQPKSVICEGHKE